MPMNNDYRLFFISSEKSKLIVAGGNRVYEDLKSVEVVNLESSNQRCDLLPDLPFKIQGATGQVRLGKVRQG